MRVQHEILMKRVFVNCPFSLLRLFRDPNPLKNLTLHEVSKHLKSNFYYF